MQSFIEFKERNYSLVIQWKPLNRKTEKRDIREIVSKLLEFEIFTSTKLYKCRLLMFSGNERFCVIPPPSP